MKRSQNYIILRGWGYILVVEYLRCMCQGLGLIPSTQKYYILKLEFT